MPTRVRSRRVGGGEVGRPVQSATGSRASPMTVFKTLLGCALLAVGLLGLAWSCGFFASETAVPYAPDTGNRSGDPQVTALAPASGPPAESTVSPDGERTVRDGVEVRGRVADQIGHAVAGAQVRMARGHRSPLRRAASMFADVPATELTAVVAARSTDAAGAFAFPVVAAGNYTVYVEHPDHPSLAYDELVVGSEPGGELLLVLEPGAAISGRIVGAPATAAGLAVALVAERPEAVAYPASAAPPSAVGDRLFGVASDGTFTLRGLRHTHAYRLHAAWQPRPRSFRIGSDAVRVVAGTNGVELAWNDGITVTAHVVSAASGAAVVSGRVEYRSDGPDAGAATSPSVGVFTDGRFELGPFWPRRGNTLSLEVSAVGFATRSLVAIVLPEDRDLDLGSVVLQPMPVAGVLVLGGVSNAPVPEATVEMRVATPRDGAPAGAPATTRAKSGKDGRCAFTVSPGVAVVFVARARGMATASIGPITLPAANSEHTLRMSPASTVGHEASLRGRVLCNGSALAAASIVVESEAEIARVPRVGSTGGDGGFAVEDLPVGAARVLVDHRTFAVPVPRTIELRAGSNSVDWSLQTVALRARVVDVEGRAIAGASVRLLVDTEARVRVGNAQTAVDGAFAFDGVAIDAAIRLRIDAAGFAPLLEPITSGDREQVFVLQATGRIDVVATVASATAVRATATAPAPGATALAVRSAAITDGKVALEGIAAGRWRVDLLGRAGELLATREVEVVAGKAVATTW